MDIHIHKADFESKQKLSHADYQRVHSRLILSSFSVNIMEKEKG